MVQTVPTSLPTVMLQAGKKVLCRVSYLIRQGTETQKPVLGLLQDGRELTVAELQGQSDLGDLIQVTGAQFVQVLVQVGGRGFVLDIAQGLAVKDRWDVPDEQEPSAYPSPGTHVHVHTHVHRPPQQASHPQPTFWAPHVSQAPSPA